MARTRGLDEGEDVVIVVALEEISMREMSSTLFNLRRTSTWLDWYAYENDREQSWELLTRALVPPVPRQNAELQREEWNGNSEDRPLMSSRTFYDETATGSAS